MSFLKNLAWHIIWHYNSLRIGQLGANSNISPYVTLRGFTNNISIGHNVLVSPRVTIQCDSKSSYIYISNHTVITDFCILATYGGNIEIGNFCNINSFTILYGHGGLKIGNNVLIAAHTVIIPANHGFTDKDQLIRSQQGTKKGIVIEDDVWIGSGCKILDGITIGKGSVIGAGTVCTKDVEPYSVIVGVPGKLLKRRGE